MDDTRWTESILERVDSGITIGDLKTLILEKLRLDGDNWNIAYNFEDLPDGNPLVNHVHDKTFTVYFTVRMINDHVEPYLIIQPIIVNVQLSDQTYDIETNKYMTVREFMEACKTKIGSSIEGSRMTINDKIFGIFGRLSQRNTNLWFCRIR